MATPRQLEITIDETRAVRIVLRRHMSHGQNVVNRQRIMHQCISP
jgi:hypothetical protein